MKTTHIKKYKVMSTKPGEFAEKLQKFGVQKIRIFLAADFTDEWKST